MSEGRGREAGAEALLLVVVVIWAANYPVAKFGIAGLNPFVFNALRFVIAAAVLAGLFVARSKWTPIAAADRGPLLRTSLLGGILYQAAFIVGLSLTSAGNTAVLISTSPLWTIIIHARIHRERIQPQVLAGMAISLAGVVMIVVGSGAKLEWGSGALLGDLVTLGAAGLWGLNNNLQRPLLLRYSALQITLVMISAGAAGLSLMAVPFALSVPWADVPWTVYAATALSGATSIGIGILIWSYGVRRLGAGRTSSFNNLVPVLAFVISYFTLNEELVPLQIAGAAVTVAGVWIARR